jgi:hypothetical protein
MKFNWELQDVKCGQHIYIPGEQPMDIVLGSTSMTDEGNCFHFINLRGAYFYPAKAMNREQVVTYLNANKAYPVR